MLTFLLKDITPKNVLSPSCIIEFSLYWRIPNKDQYAEISSP